MSVKNTQYPFAGREVRVGKEEDRRLGLGEGRTEEEKEDRKEGGRKRG